MKTLHLRNCCILLYFTSSTTKVNRQLKSFQTNPEMQNYVKSSYIKCFVPLYTLTCAPLWWKCILGMMLTTYWDYAQLRQFHGDYVKNAQQYYTYYSKWYIQYMEFSRRTIYNDLHATILLTLHIYSEDWKYSLHKLYNFTA